MMAAFLARRLLGESDPAAQFTGLSDPPTRSAGDRGMFGARLYRFAKPGGLMPMPVPTPSEQALAACRLALAADGKTMDGVKRALAAWPTLNKAAIRSGIDLRELGAMGIHESNFVADKVQPDGMGRGALQIDLGANPSVQTAQANDISFAARFAASMLARNRAVLAQRYPQFTDDQLTHAAIASYNKGTNPIKWKNDPLAIDWRTAHGNYSRNVLGLMHCFPPPAK